MTFISTIREKGQKSILIKISKLCTEMTPFTPTLRKKWFQGHLCSPFVSSFRFQGHRRSYLVYIIILFLFYAKLVPLRFIKAGRVFLVAHERPPEPRVTIEWLLAKQRSSSNLPAFLDFNGIKFCNIFDDCWDLQS